MGFNDLLEKFYFLIEKIIPIKLYFPINFEYLLDNFNPLLYNADIVNGNFIVLSDGIWHLYCYIPFVGHPDDFKETLVVKSHTFTGTSISERGEIVNFEYIFYWVIRENENKVLCEIHKDSNFDSNNINLHSLQFKNIKTTYSNGNIKLEFEGLEECIQTKACRI